MKITDMQLGKAGEYLVCADLILKGFIAYPSEQGLPYDVVLDNGNKLIKVQVKTTEKPRKIPQRNKQSLAYIFSIKRAGKNNRRERLENEADIFSLVCLDTGNIGYITSDSMPATINIRVDSLRGKYYDEDGLATFAKLQELRHKHTQTEIAEMLKKHVSVINRMCKPGYVPHKTKARYFSDFIRSAEWFNGL